MWMTTALTCTEVSIAGIAMARCKRVHRGSKSWHGYREAVLNLGDLPARLKGGRVHQLKGDAPDGY